MLKADIGLSGYPEVDIGVSRLAELWRSGQDIRDKVPTRYPGILIATT